MKGSSCSNGFDPSSVPSSSSKSEQFLDEKARIFELYDLGSKLKKSCKQCPDIDDVLSDASGLSNQSASLRLSDVSNDDLDVTYQEDDWDAPRATVHEGRRNEMLLLNALSMSGSVCCLEKLRRRVFTSAI